MLYFICFIVGGILGIILACSIAAYRVTQAEARIDHLQAENKVLREHSYVDINII